MCPCYLCSSLRFGNELKWTLTKDIKSCQTTHTVHLHKLRNLKCVIVDYDQSNQSNLYKSIFVSEKNILGCDSTQQTFKKQRRSRCWIFQTLVVVSGRGFGWGSEKTAATETCQHVSERSPEPARDTGPAQQHKPSGAVGLRLFSKPYRCQVTVR